METSLLTGDMTRHYDDRLVTYFYLEKVIALSVVAGNLTYSILTSPYFYCLGNSFSPSLEMGMVYSSRSGTKIINFS